MLNKAWTLWRLYQLNGLGGLLRRCCLQVGYRRFSRPASVYTAKSPTGSVVVYTAAFGDSARNLKPCRSADCPHICFTDDPQLKIDGWRMKVVAKKGLTPRRAARKTKLLPHHYLPEFDWWIWQDASMQLEVSALSLLRECQGRDFAAFRHPERNCTYREAEAIKWLRLDSTDLVDRQLNRYRDQQFPESQGLLETAIVIRRNCPKVIAFNETWWRELHVGSERDQLGLMVSLRKHGICYSALPGCREDNPFAVYRNERLGSSRRGCVEFV